MKKQLITFISISLICLSTAAQQVPRNMVVVEIGTGTWCQYCPGAAMGADDLIANGYDVAIIENHNGDDYANTYSNSRNSYYGVPGFPTAYFDGLNAVVGGSHDVSMFPQYSAKVNARMNIMSSFTIEVSGTHTCLTDFTAHVTVEKVASNTSTNLKLHTVVTESHIEEAWQGMDEVNWVCRTMSPNQSGTVVNFASGTTQEFDIPFFAGADWVLEECEVVVFLQDQTTKEIFQSNKIPLLDFLPEYQLDASVKQLFDLPKTSCTGSFEPTINLRNIGAATMNSVDIYYQVNDGTPLTFAWAGNLDYLGEEMVSLPAITFTGEDDNELIVYTSNPNGNSDECPSNDNQAMVIPDAMHTPNLVKLILRTDANPAETTWELKNSAGELLYQGGPYSTSGQMIQETFNLTEEDCFTFIINDTGGDGLINPGFYMLYYGSNTVISQGVDFGYKEMVDFSTVDVVGIDENKDQNTVEVYPNPLKDKASIEINMAQAAQVQVRVFSVTGQVMLDTDQGLMTAGQHTVLLDATTWKQGLYVYQVITGDKIFSGKLTVN